MSYHNLFKTSATATAFAGIVFSGLMLTSRSGQAANDKNPTQDEKQKIQIGQQITPVLLNLKGKDPDTVYLGSYIVNAVGGCNDCHTAPSYALGGDPYQLQPKAVNAAHFLAGGAPFGPLVTSRNITPDSTGKPAGLSYSDFVQVIRMGTDFDHIHPVLQVMPWPVYQNMTDRDLTAIYTYLSAIPCREGDPGVSSEATHRCAN